MKYGYYDLNESPSPIEDYTEGAHIIVLRKVKEFIHNSVELEDGGWEVRDSIKVILHDDSIHATLFRKPFKGTVAQNVLTNGCGGINIDACRVGQFTNTRPSGMVRWNDFRHGDSKYSTEETVTVKEGRFPANLLLECTCKVVIEGKSEGVVINTKKGLSTNNDITMKYGHSKGEQEAPRAYKDTGAIHSEGNCPCLKINIQSGDTSSTRIGNPNNINKDVGNSLFGGVEQKVPSTSKDYRDGGGASRFFYNFKTMDELKTYLTNLIKC